MDPDLSSPRLPQLHRGSATGPPEKMPQENRIQGLLWGKD